jgi:glutathione S-transferase
LTCSFHVPSIDEDYDIAEARAFRATALEMLEREPTSSAWLAGPHPTIADIPCYPHIARAAESGYELENYRAVYPRSHSLAGRKRMGASVISGAPH